MQSSIVSRRVREKKSFIFHIAERKKFRQNRIIFIPKNALVHCMLLILLLYITVKNISHSIHFKHQVKFIDWKLLIEKSTFTLAPLLCYKHLLDVHLAIYIGRGWKGRVVRKWIFAFRLQIDRGKFFFAYACELKLMNFV